MNIAFSLTTPQFRQRIKRVTRRMGFEKVKAGDVLQAIVKGQGLKKGEKIEVLGKIRIIGARREQLQRMIDDPTYGRTETTLEGFPEGDELHDPAKFVEFFCKSHKGCTPLSSPNRIEYEYL